MDEKFEAIVVGAGPAGTSAAIVLARAGVKVLLLERGDYPGSKNVMGGVLYRQATEEIIPEFWKEAPLERRVVEQRLWVVSGEAAVTLGYKSDRFSREPYNAFTVLRAKFDRWFARQAEKAGALLVTETVADDLLVEGERVVGVRTDRPDGDLRADVVILAEGVNSLLTWKAGLRGDISPNHLAVAVKEIIALPAEKIQDRFNLEDGEGATIELVGEVTRGMVGTAFIYTNHDSLSVGVGVLISDLIEKIMTPNDLLEGVKNHPLVRPLLAGGETKEYLGHMIPEGGYRHIPRLFRDGLLVVGDAAMLVNGIQRQGSNMAMTSGRLAAETVLEAREKGDFSARTLSIYREKLKNSYVLQDLYRYRNASRYFEGHRELFDLYPHLLTEAAYQMTTVDGTPKQEKRKRVIQHIRRQRPLWRIARDLAAGWRVLG